MILREWILSNIDNFNSSVKTEEDLKVKVLVPFLHELGYKDDEFRYENSIIVSVDTKKTTVRSDIEILINGKVQLVIDTKKPSNGLAEKDVLQSVSYAKLVDTPPALYGIITNGVDCVVTNVYNGQRSVDIPTRAELLRDIDKAKK